MVVSRPLTATRISIYIAIISDNGKFIRQTRDRKRTKK